MRNKRTVAGMVVAMIVAMMMVSVPVEAAHVPDSNGLRQPVGYEMPAVPDRNGLKPPVAYEIDFDAIEIVPDIIVWDGDGKAKESIIRKPWSTKPLPVPVWVVY